ncbi:MAG: hypothetical protein ACJAVV_000425 [Alphaproteobacteria bacterium]|jgi:hypothetical protein
MKAKVIGLLIVSLGLNACGGSDSGNTNNNRPNLPPTTIAPSTGNITPLIDNQTVQIYGESQTLAGGAIGFALVPKGTRQVDSISWQQTSGPTLTFLANNSQTVGFDVPTSGNYSLNVNVKMIGESQSSSFTVDFSAAAGQQKAAVRLDHTATELSKVSLHVGVPDGKTMQNVVWTQLGGPQAQNVTPQDAFLFFDAPSVIADSVLKYRANVSYTDGGSGEDEVLVTIKDVDFDTNGLFYGNNNIISEDMYAYRANSPFKNALERCVYNNYIPNPPACTFQDLPLIGMQTRTPSVEDVLNRTLVSHAWMGDRFADYLQNSAAGLDMLNLLRGVTAVIISYDVRPSFYWVATGAIYLDANSFWQSPAERDTLNDQPDFRSDFGSDLQFSVFWRYTKDNDYYPKPRIDKQGRAQRDFSDVEASISWLMYHELAHANDFFSPDSWSAINTNTTPLAYFQNNGTSSDILSVTLPLRSSEMHSLAQVRFDNQTPTTIERNYAGTDVEGFFTPDIAASFYSYFTEREDFATLVERYMMLYRLDAEADLAIIDGRTSSDEPLVVWGQRNRISESSLEDRTVYALSRVYPELDDVRVVLRSLPVPVLMAPNLGWFENLEISPEDTNPFGNSALNRLINREVVLRKKLTPAQRNALERDADTDIHKGRFHISN